MLKILLILNLFVVQCIQCIQCLNGVLWNKKLESFVSIFDVPSFQQKRAQLLAESYELEAHNFNKKPLRLLFHQERGIINSYGGNDKITGFFGEIYTFLSEYANFTLILNSVPEKRVGIRPSLTSSYNGLLRYIERNSSDIIAKIEVFSYWLDVVDFFLPLWNDRFSLYVQDLHHSNGLWIANLLKYDVWIAVVFTYTLFISISIFNQTYISKQKIKNRLVDYCFEYMLYYHGFFSQRSFYIMQIQKYSKILNMSASLFSMLFLSFYSAKILYLMFNNIPFQPFNSLETLHQKTDYIVLSEKDSVIHLAYEFMLIYKNLDADHPMRPLIESKRIKFLPTRDLMYSVGCSNTQNYALFESEYLKRKIIKYGCEFVPIIGDKYFQTWVAGGVRKNFTYKRTFDRGILKLFESGILNGLKKRLIGLKQVNFDKPYEPIDLNKINTVLMVFLGGIIISIILFTIEQVYSKKQWGNSTIANPLI